MLAEGRAPTLDGLTPAEVADRVAAGQVNDVPASPSRTVAQIFRANIFTRFNALLGGMLVVMLVVGPIQDALFGFVLIANAVVGIGQELRAKRTLDRLAVLTAPRARIVRDGTVAELRVGDVVLDDGSSRGRGSGRGRRDGARCTGSGARRVAALRRVGAGGEGPGGRDPLGLVRGGGRRPLSSHARGAAGVRGAPGR
jgi:hypothetical protein